MSLMTVAADLYVSCRKYEQNMRFVDEVDDYLLTQNDVVRWNGAEVIYHLHDIEECMKSVETTPPSGEGGKLPPLNPGVTYMNGASLLERAAKVYSYGRSVPVDVYLDLQFAVDAIWQGIDLDSNLYALEV